MSPDNTLVLLNGKRRHRSAVIYFFGGGISDGAHGPNIGVFPSLGLKQVEVLRDGASSQYGADALSDVQNLFDAFPDENEFAGVAGSLFPATAPFGFSGGQYYLRANYEF